MKGKRKNYINVEGSGEMKREKGWKSVNIKKKNLKSAHTNPKVELKKIWVGLDSGTK